MNVSPTLRDQINRIVKQAAEETEAERCPKCGESPTSEHIAACATEGCPYKKGAQEKESQMGGDYGQENVTMGGGAGMTTTASAEPQAFAAQLRKLASASRYCSENFHQIVDDRPVPEKLAELMAFQTTVDKIAQGEVGKDGLLENTENKYVPGEQTEPHKGKQVVPHKTPVTAMGELEDNRSDDRTGEEWTEDPLRGKKASVSFRRVMKKLAQGEMPGAAPPAPAGPPPAGPPAPAPAAPMPAGPPQPPPGPDPRQVAQQLMAQGALTPEALSQAAGISPEEAAAIIAAMTGGTGAPQPPAAAPPAAPPAAGPGAAPGAAAPPAAAGGGGMPVTASADPAAVFQNALRKIAGEDVSKANISAGKTDKRPEDESAAVPSNPGREFIQSNEGAIAMRHDQGNEQAKKPALNAVLTNKPPVMSDAGSGAASNVDSMLGDKTSSVKNVARAYVAKLAEQGGHPLK
jgi:hypothetical protein